MTYLDFMMDRFTEVRGRMYDLNLSMHHHFVVSETLARSSHVVGSESLETMARFWAAKANRELAALGYEIEALDRKIIRIGKWPKLRVALNDAAREGGWFLNAKVIGALNVEV